MWIVERQRQMIDTRVKKKTFTENQFRMQVFKRSERCTHREITCIWFDNCSGSDDVSFRLYQFYLRPCGERIVLDAPRSMSARSCVCAWVCERRQQRPRYERLIKRTYESNTPMKMNMNWDTVRHMRAIHQLHSGIGMSRLLLLLLLLLLVCMYADDNNIITATALIPGLCVWEIEHTFTYIETGMAEW